MDRRDWETAFKALRNRIGDAISPHLALSDAMLLRHRIKIDDESLWINELGPVAEFYMVIDEDAERPTLRLEDIRIEHDRMGQGVGTAMILAASGVARELGLDINLSANPMKDFGDPERPAAFARLIAYYQRLGFEDETPGCPAGNMIIRAPGPDITSVPNW
ncbi:hypothetical protein ACEUZ9_004104 [Paracoccus litorisediminis]|uniref:hypothetical protein n=1 Tax=Paracoccus litorisediminis TaxID=2006130 RepID=UPI003731CFAF